MDSPYEIARDFSDKTYLTLQDRQMVLCKNHLDEYIQLYVPAGDVACLSLIVSPYSDSIDLILLEARNACFTPAYTGSGLGSILLKFAIELCKNRLRASSICVFDTAEVQGLDLGLHLLLTKGETWYGQYGFVPVNKEAKSIHEAHKQFVSSLRVGDLEASLQDKLAHTVDQNISVALKKLFERDKKLYMETIEHLARKLGLTKPYMKYAQQFGNWILIL